MVAAGQQVVHTITQVVSILQALDNLIAGGLAGRFSPLRTVHARHLGSALVEELPCFPEDPLGFHHQHDGFLRGERLPLSLDLFEFIDGFLVFPAGGVDEAGSSHYWRLGNGESHGVFLSDSGTPSHVATGWPFPHYNAVSVVFFGSNVS